MMTIDDSNIDNYVLKTSKLTINNYNKEIEKLEAIVVDENGNKIYRHLMAHLFLDEAKRIAIGVFCVKTRKDNSFSFVNECRLSVFDGTKIMELYTKMPFDIRSFYGYGVLLSPHDKIREKKTEKFYIYTDSLDKGKGVEAIIDDFKKHEKLLALMLEKNCYQSFNNIGNEITINLYTDLILKTYSLPKLKTAYSNITSLKFFLPKRKTKKRNS